MLGHNVGSSSRLTAQRQQPQVQATSDRRRRLQERGLPLFLWQAAEWRMRAVGRRILLPETPDTTNTAASADSGRTSARMRARFPLLEFVVAQTTVDRLTPSGARVLRLVRRIARPVLRPIRASVGVVHRLIRRLLLTNHRGNAKAFWPGVTGLDLWILAAWLALLRFHKQLLFAVGASAIWLRRVRKPVPGRAGHVLHVTASFDLGGTQTQIKNLCETGSTIARHEVVEIFPEHNYLYRQRVTVDLARYSGGGPFGRALGLLIKHGGTRSSQIIQIGKLVKDFRAARPEVVVGWGHEISMITFVAAAIARVPHIVFCIRTFNPSFGWVSPEMGRLLYVTHKRMVPYLSRLIVNSTPLRRDYAAWLGIDENIITVCANGIDARIDTPASAIADRTAIRDRYAIAHDALVLVHVGRFSAEKGQMSLMHANAALLRRHPNRRFVWLLCGDGPTMPEVRRCAEENGFANVVFAGRITDVHAHLVASDIFVMPSDFEGMPNAMMEAMAAGLPAISTDRSGAVDVARDRIEALYYPPRDVARLVDHLTLLIDEDDERRAMGQRARARMKEFSVARSASTFDSSIRELLTGRETPP